MDRYRLGGIGGGLGCHRIDASRGCGLALLGRNGDVCLEMLVLSEEIELEGHRYSHRKLRRSSFIYYKISHNCFEMRY